MKKKLIAISSLACACVASAMIVSIPATVMNSSIPSIAMAEALSVHGNLIYRQKIALPNHASIQIQLQDVSEDGTLLETIAQATLQHKTQVPIPFSLSIDPNKLQQDHHYQLNARIMVGDSLWFVNDSPVRFEGSNASKPHDIYLAAVNQNDQNQETPNTIIGQDWVVEDIFNNGIIDSSHITLSVEALSNGIPAENGANYRVSGTGGCNRYMSHVLINEADETLQFSPPSMTFMACVEAITQQEARFIDMLTKARSYEFDPLGRLFMKDADDTIIARLVPDM